MTHEEKQAHEIVRSWYDDHIQTVVLSAPDRRDLEKVIAAALDQAAQPVWTREKPTVAGAYWFRSHQYSARIVEVKEEIETGVLIWCDCESTWDLVDRPNESGEWAPCVLPREA